MKRLSWFTFILFCPVLISSQTTSTTLSEAQRSLKKVLDKDAPYISSVKFDGCRVLIRSVSRQTYWSGSRPSGMTGAMLTRDDSSNYLSGGGENLVFEGKSSVYELDLAKLDASKISIGQPSKRALASITIEDSLGGLIVVKKPDEMFSRFFPGKYRIVTNKRSVEKTVRAFQDVAKVCSTEQK